MKRLDSEYSEILPELRKHCSAAIGSFGNLNNSGDVDLHAHLKEFFLLHAAEFQIFSGTKSDKKNTEKKSQNNPFYR